jgi:hypothetical protein
MRFLRAALVPISVLVGAPVQAGPVARTASALVRRVGGAADRCADACRATADSLSARGARVRARALRLAGTVVGGTLGYETLSKTSLEVGAGPRLFVPGFKVANAGWLTHYWTGDVASHEAGKVTDQWNHGFVANTPVSVASFTTLGKLGGGLHLPGVAASVDARNWYLEAGLPGIFVAGVGEFEGRGKYFGIHVGIPIPGASLGPFGVQLNYRVHVFSPLLDPIGRLRPAAVAVRDFGAKVSRRLGLAKLQAPMTHRRFDDID